MNRRSPAAALVLGALLAWAPGGEAQTAAPDAQAMVQALTPKLRQSRNLLVRPRAASEAEAAASAPVADTAQTAASAAAAIPVAAPSLSLSIEFKPNSAALGPESGPLLGELCAALLSPELRGARFVIEGHTDAVGSAAANLRLSQDRADEVREYLLELGIAPGRLRAVGKGASEPLNALDPRAPENRRVRIVTLP